MSPQSLSGSGTYRDQTELPNLRPVNGSSTGSETKFQQEGSERSLKAQRECFASYLPLAESLGSTLSPGAEDGVGHEGSFLPQLRNSYKNTQKQKITARIWGLISSQGTCDMMQSLTQQHLSGNALLMISVVLSSRVKPSAWQIALCWQLFLKRVQITEATSSKILSGILLVLNQLHSLVLPTRTSQTEHPQLLSISSTGVMPGNP